MYAFRDMFDFVGTKSGVCFHNIIILRITKEHTLVQCRTSWGEPEREHAYAARRQAHMWMRGQMHPQTQMT